MKANSLDSTFVSVDTNSDSPEWNTRNGYRDTCDLNYRNINSTKYQYSSSEPYEILDLEIDRGCKPSSCWESPHSLLLGSETAGTIPLYKYNEIPSFLQGNPFIIQGYRSLLPFSLCYKSLYLWTNETINIWSHLLGFGFFFMLLFYDNFIGIPENGGTTSDHIICSLGVMCFMFCLICSAGYHVFNCHSERACNRWLTLDLTGISVGLIGCYLPGIHYSFYCTSIWRDVYLLSCSVLFCVVLFFQMSPRFLNWRWYKRVGFFCSVSGFGVIPAAHWFYLNGGTSANIVQIFFPKVIVVYFIGGLAFFFYLSKFPEKFFPGRFDFVGSSHQIWHLLVMIAFFWWHQAGKDILAYRSSHPCLE